MRQVELIPGVAYITLRWSVTIARLGGATVARLTPVQKVACSNHVRVTCGFSDSRFETCLGCSDDSNIKKSNVNIQHAI